MDDGTMINYIRQNVDMGISGIEKVIPHAKSLTFVGALEAELREYQNLSSEADGLLREAGAKEVDAPVMARMSADIMTTVKCMTYGSDSDIAEDMIKGTTTGITKLRQHLTRFRGSGNVSSLAEKVIATEERNVEEMKKFL